VDVYGNGELLSIICKVHELQCERHNLDVAAMIAQERERLARRSLAREGTTAALAPDLHSS